MVSSLISPDVTQQNIFICMLSGAVKLPGLQVLADLLVQAALQDLAPCSLLHHLYENLPEVKASFQYMYSSM